MNRAEYVVHERRSWLTRVWHCLPVPERVLEADSRAQVAHDRARTDLEKGPGSESEPLMMNVNSLPRFATIKCIGLLRG